MAIPTPVPPGLLEAVREAERFVGATCPNPPVGAAALDAQGKILAVAAHEKAGTAHAEAAVLAACETAGTLGRVATLVVTLEPCNHQGRTPPCTEAILRTAKRGVLRKVIFGEHDPNPQVAGEGAQRLREAGLEVEQVSIEATRELLAPFAHRCQTGLPWVTVKVARTESGSMIPPAGQKTFTSASSLDLAHILRKRADAILTGSGTVLADRPELTVRRVADYPGKRRWLVVLDRRRRTPSDWIEAREAQGFEVLIRDDFETARRELGAQGALEILVEAGPTLTEWLLQAQPRQWNRAIEIRLQKGSPDAIRVL